MDFQGGFLSIERFLALVWNFQSQGSRDCKFEGLRLLCRGLRFEFWWGIHGFRISMSHGISGFKVWVLGVQWMKGL